MEWARDAELRAKLSTTRTRKPTGTGICTRRIRKCYDIDVQDSMQHRSRPA